ncbi:hypothetical protein MNBD_GAMMA23-2104 [hydrothermal vent metagenome]|uniref:TonB C-terminal domain-containing protein n=1 Tax=hydrothermal vent metagenome TaxID=652676 RepID=A0A3B0ZVD7_9ZZZZ
MKIKNNIAIFIAVSLLLHMLLFIEIMPQEIILPANTGNIISITISETTEAKTKPTPIQQAIKKPVTNKLTMAKQVNEKIIGKKSVQKTTGNMTKKQKPSTLPPAHPHVASAASQTQIISLLKDKIKQHFYYPKIAQRQNWQGKVLLVFDINTHGFIKNITVKKSSGYSILDTAAMKSLTKVSTIPQDWIKSEYYSSLKLTVKYRLEEG